MSTSDSAAETLDFAACAETNPSSENTIDSANSILTDQRSAISSTPLSWNVLPTTGNPQVNSHSEAMSSRSRPPKRQDNNRDARSPKSPRRATRGSRSGEGPLTADQRLDMLLRESASRLPDRQDPTRVEYVIGPPAVVMGSPPREMLRMVNPRPENIPITETTSDEQGGYVTHPIGGEGRTNMLDQEVVLFTQRQLTAEFELAELHIQIATAEMRERNAERALSQEMHFFTQARTLMEEMRNAFTVEDQGCTRRIEMLEDQCNENASSPVAFGNHAANILHEKHAEYSEKINRLKQQAEAYVGSQSEDISRLRQELSKANQELVIRQNFGRKQNEVEKEIAFRNGYLSN